MNKKENDYKAEVKKMALDVKKAIVAELFEEIDKATEEVKKILLKVIEERVDFPLELQQQINEERKLMRMMRMRRLKKR